jgi:hypothetical protein
MLAVRNYEQAHAAYPPGAVYPPEAPFAASGSAPLPPVANVPGARHLGWICHLLPYLEQTVRADFSHGPYHAHNAALRSARLAVLTCAADRSRSGPPAAAASNYAACHHDVEAPIAEDNHGVFYLHSRVTGQMVVDGLSNTIFLGEKRDDGAGELGWLSGTRATLRNTGTPLNARQQPVAVQRGLRLARQSDDLRPGPEPANGSGLGSAANALFVGGFASGHAGGAHFAFGDARVQFVDESIDAAVYRQLGHRADGKLLDVSFMAPRAP